MHDDGPLTPRELGLRAVLREWDFIGVFEDEDNLAPDDEYDCLIDGLLGALQSGLSAHQIATFLHDTLAHHFGMGGGPPPTKWAERFIEWYRDEGHALDHRPT